MSSAITAAAAASARRPSTPTCDLVSAAVQYASCGIAVMPLHTPLPDGTCSCRDRNRCDSPGKHPRLRHGLLDARTDPALIHQWWQRWPDANIGLATGTVLDVCDVDTGDALATVLDVLGVVRPDAPLVRTGYGWHLWYAASDLPSRVGLLPGVDWRGHGGLIVAPPSLHTTGRRYTFQQPWTTAPDLPACPPPLRRLVLPPPPLTTPGDTPSITHLDRYAQAALTGEIQRIRQAPRPHIRNGRRLTGGGRNNALNLAAFRLGQLAANGAIDEATVWHQLTDAALRVGLDAAEAHRTIRSGWKAGLQRPRR
ncbi:bifunctional DNA primase/polymerase [Actinoplanes aureus]|uniref:Bifunctional DNA primase/polymerase n=1 Tax=Actinoplanes aureus TaxID=2792083 RepID=A0A931CLV9_9ACTN|nr:bifunctional DNA primase/polymerase [Actinoplanes aureus]MBG0568796.1 bifunctional DNA primase/polymerase [Actinoplanes aureus]